MSPLELPDTGEDAQYVVRAALIDHSQIGNGNTQINYSINPRTWADRPGAPPLATISGHIESPYRGLSAFEESDAPFFFGRGATTTDVLERMARRVNSPGLLVISGVSGAGKSSLLRGGILPQLRGVGLSGDTEARQWPCLLITPSHSPLDELAVCVASLAGVDAASVRTGLERDPSEFALIARQAAIAHAGAGADRVGQARLLLVVDQFEQLFTRCSNETHRRAFISALHATATIPQGESNTPAALVVVLVREDFEARCTDYPELEEAVQDRYLVTPMRELELREAITEPAKIAGARVDQQLVEALLEEIRTRVPVPNGDPRAPAFSGAGLLPQMSHALDKAWRNRAADTVLSLHDYVRIGGIQDSIAQSAQKTFNSLTSRQQIAAQQVFVRLTAAADNGINLADRSTRNDLVAGKTPDQKLDVDAVLEAFAAQRLLTLAAGSVEISHEVLLASWPLLRDTWLAETHNDRIIRNRLRTTATEWEHKGEDSSYLYGGSLLEAAVETCERIEAEPERHPRLSLVEQNFMGASKRARRRSRRRRQIRLAVAMVLVCSLVVFAIREQRAKVDANHQRDIAISRQLIAQSETMGDADPAVARLDSLAAWSIHRSVEARYAMVVAASLPGVAVLTGHTGAVSSVAFSRDGKTLASAGDDGTARLWNTTTYRQIGRPIAHLGKVSSVAFSPDGKTLASAGATVRLWNTATHHHIGQRPVPNLTYIVSSVAFSPDGRTLASAGDDRGVLLWDTAANHQIGRPLPHTDGASSVAFSSDGRLLATTAFDGTMRLWNATTQRQVGKPITGDRDGLNSAAFSPDNRRLVTTSRRGTVRLWNVATHLQIGQPLTGHTSSVTSAAFSPDGRRLATTSFDDTVRLWDTTTHQQIGQSLTGHAGPVNSVAFSPDGKTLATAGADGTVRLWNVYDHMQVGEPLADLTMPVSSAFSPDGRRLATASSDGTVRLWDATTHEQIGQPFIGHRDEVMAIAFSPDGRRLASAASDRTVRLWSVATHRQLGQPLVGHTSSVTSIAFSPDGRHLATTSFDGTVRLWNATTHRQSGRPLISGTMWWTSVAFNPDGKTLAASGADHTVRLWQIPSRRQIGQPLTGHGEPVNSVAFSPNGKTLASASADGTVRLWNVATRHQIGNPIGTGPVDSAVFSPDGRALASAGVDGTLRLWDVVTHQQIGQPVIGNISRLSSLAFSPDGRTLVSTSADESARLWHVGYLVDVQSRLCAEVADSLAPSTWARYVPQSSNYRHICPY